MFDTCNPAFLHMQISCTWIFIYLSFYKPRVPSVHLPTRCCQTGTNLASQCVTNVPTSICQTADNRGILPFSARCSFTILTDYSNLKQHFVAFFDNRMYVLDYHFFYFYWKPLLKRKIASLELKQYAHKLSWSIQRPERLIFQRQDAGWDYPGSEHLSWAG